MGKIDGILHKCAVDICNAHFDDTGWRIATLPIRFGGLGLRSVFDISEVAYLASMHATEGLVKNILSNFSESLFDNSLAVRVQSWSKRNFVLPETKSSQLQWDQINFKKVYENLKLMHVESHFYTILAGLETYLEKQTTPSISAVTEQEKSKSLLTAFLK